jgi:putative PIN family toxin of toxin-antitoxin system
MKVVLDTNILVSALIKAGKPRDLFNKLVKEQNLVLSRAILEEFLEVIDDPKIAKYTSEKDVTVFLNTLKNSAKIVQVKSKFKAVKDDPDDDAIVHVACDSKANYIISGDKHLLALKHFMGIRILTVDEMLNELNH